MNEKNIALAEEVLHKLEAMRLPEYLSLTGWARMQGGGEAGNYLLLVQRMLQGTGIWFRESYDGLLEISICPEVYVTDLEHNYQKAFRYGLNFQEMLQEAEPGCMVKIDDCHRLCVEYCGEGSAEQILKQLLRMVFLVECNRCELEQVCCTGEVRGYSLMEQLRCLMILAEETGTEEELRELLLDRDWEGSRWGEPMTTWRWAEEDLPELEDVEGLREEKPEP